MNLDYNLIFVLLIIISCAFIIVPLLLIENNKNYYVKIYKKIIMFICGISLFLYTVVYYTPTYLKDNKKHEQFYIIFNENTIKEIPKDSIQKYQIDYTILKTI